MTPSEYNPSKKDLFQLDTQSSLPSIIKVIGVGGGGSNAVDHMFKMGITGVDFLICNTDAQALERSPVPFKVQLGPGLTQGRGAGSLPDVGRQAAKENIDEIRSILTENSRMVFVTAGMGGGTGTGAAPVIAGVARELGALTVGIVTMPFQFEGRKRLQQAEKGIEEMKKNVDALLIIQNDKLREIYGNLNISSAFGKADDVLTIAAKSIAEVITKYMHINLDFADVETVMKNSGVAIMGSASASGDNRAIRAVEQALDSPLLNDNQIVGARYVLLNIASGTSEATMDELAEINDYVQAQAGQTAEIILGVGNDESLGDRISVTVIATGFKGQSDVSAGLKPETERIVHVLSSEPELPQPAVSVQEPENEPEESEDSFSPGPVFSMEPVLLIRDEVSLNLESVVDFGVSTPEQSEAVNEISTDEERVVFTLEDNPGESFVFQVDIEEEPEMSEHEQEDLAPRAPAEEFQQPSMFRESEADEVPQKQSADNEFGQRSAEEEMYERSRQRLMHLKSLSYARNSPNGIADLEKEPAYKRKQIKLDQVPNSGDTNVSRYTLGTDETDGKPEIRTNNSFLHDRVD